MMTVLFCLAMLQDAAQAEEYWKFKAGTAWEFSESQSGLKCTSRVEAKELRDGKLILESKREVEGEPPQTKKMQSYEKDGFVVWAEEGEDGVLREYLRIWKIGAKEGDTWTSRMAEGTAELTIKHLGIETVKVGAGEYKDATHLQFEMKDEEKGQSLTGEYWLVPNVGLVKMQMKQAGEEIYSLELTKFEPCK